MAQSGFRFRKKTLTFTREAAAVQGPRHGLVLNPHYYFLMGWPETIPKSNSVMATKKHMFVSLLCLVFIRDLGIDSSLANFFKKNSFEIYLFLFFYVFRCFACIFACVSCE